MTGATLVGEDIMVAYKAAFALVNGLPDADGKVEKFKLPKRLEYALGRIVRHTPLRLAAGKWEGDYHDLFRLYGTEITRKEKDVETGEEKEVGTGSFSVRKDIENYAEFKERLDELNAETIEVPYTLRLSWFSDIDYQGLLANLGPLVVDDTDEVREEVEALLGELKELRQDLAQKASGETT